MLSSCKQFKAITASDNSVASSKPSKRSGQRGVKFLEDISVTHGQTSTTKVTTGPVAPRSTTNSRLSNTPPSGDIERADWLQLKYAIMLDANVEKLNNVSMLKTIDEWWGTRYCMGGSTKSCIDCSAFTQTVMQSVYNLNIPRTAQEQFNYTERINLEDLNEGDLVFFQTSGRSISHVGVYLLNNKFVHAATSGGVMVSDLNDSYWQPRFKGAGRVRDGKMAMKP
ncbi:C40 family peptidase [Aridibaculum aurantiacum]|uniref:C40 family peptidase n=1 Tax=Aridibaculum aurantiacum TaxID=2810307 RepID=UPI001A968D73|nr:C40 family peptidase [Aridibaculum aurantiacum]